MKKFNRAFLLSLAFCFISCASRATVKEIERPIESPAEIPVLPPVTKVPEANYLTIVAVGDNLYHATMIREGEKGDYESAYSEIRSLIKEADIAFINQETLLAGEDFGFSGYPLFNSPQNLGRAIAGVGFNVVNHATNHIMDKGEKAVLATMDFWDSIPQVKILGIHRSEEQRTLPVLVTKNNITVGFLSYTYGTNGIPVPDSKPYLVSLINTEIIAKEIDAIRPYCDFLVVSMHWGEEYQHDYNKNQETLAALLAEHYVDLVIGHHPHVIQSIEVITRPDGKDMLCFYSLGNLISSQNQNATLLGAMAYVRIKKTQEDEVDIIFPEAGAIPLVTHYEKNYTGFKVYPLYTYTGEFLDKHWKNQVKKELSLDYLNGLSTKIFGNREIQQNPFN